MEGRHDSLVAAAEMIVKADSLPERMGGNMVCTVGTINGFPNSRNIIQDRTHFTVDIRSWDDEHALAAWNVLLKDFEEISQRRGCPMRCEVTWRVEHAAFNTTMKEKVLSKA